MLKRQSFICLFIYLFIYLFWLWLCDPTRITASSFLRFLSHTQKRTTVGRTPLDEWSARRTDLYLTTHNTHNRQTPMPPPVGFEPTISAGERPQTYALDGAATGTSMFIDLRCHSHWHFSHIFFFSHIHHECGKSSDSWQFTLYQSVGRPSLARSSRTVLQLFPDLEQVMADNSLGHLQVTRVPLCHPLYHSKTCVPHTASFPYYTVRNVSCVSVGDLPGLKQNLMFAPCSLTTKLNTTYARRCYGWNGKARTFISPIPKGHNMNVQKLVYAPNHTCARVSVVKLYCLTTHIKQYSRSGSCSHPYPFVGRYICLQMSVRLSVVVKWETRREVVVAYFNRLLYRVIKIYCRGFNNLSYTIHLR